MPGRLQAEIQQRRGFRAVEEEALLNILRTADSLTRAFEEAFKPAGLSATQYNVLRILRGAGTDGLACRQIGERMITHDPDITRLLDRLESRGLVARARDRRDRRVVTTRITASGLRLLDRLDPVVAGLDRALLAHLGRARLRRLIGLLERVRAGKR